MGLDDNSFWDPMFIHRRAKGLDHQDQGWTNSNSKEPLFLFFVDEPSQRLGLTDSLVL